MTILAVACTLVIGLGLQPLLIGVLRRRQVMDIPNDRSSHVSATPRGGGIAVILAILIGWLILPGDELSAGLLVAVAAMAVLGLVEDIRGVTVGYRFAWQIVAAAVLISGAGVYDDFGLPAAALGLLYVVGAVNAVNFMDGVNGITGEVTVVMGLAFGGLFQQAEQPVLAGAALCVSAGALAFLPFNAGNAKVFLGDVGSYGLGAAVGGLSAFGWVVGVPLVAVISPLAVYIADTGITLVRRLAARERIHEAHRSHVYQRLTDCGWSHQRVAVTVAGFTAATSAVGYVGFAMQIDSLFIAAGVGVICATYVLMPRLVTSRQPIPVSE